MHIFYVRSAWKIAYPYMVVARIAVLVAGSLCFLILNQTLQPLFARSHAQIEGSLSYVNRVN